MKLLRPTGFVLGLLLAPAVMAYAQDPNAPTQIVNCGTGDLKGAPGTLTGVCTFDNLINLGDVIIRYSLRVLIIPLSIVSFAFSGFRYLTAFGSESEASKAKGQVMSTVQGVFLAFFAWLLVSTFFNFFVNDTFNPFKSL